MGITIGQKPGSSFSDPLGLLNDCHRRIEHFLNLMIIVTDQAKGRFLNQEQKEALEASLRYFREAAPKHTEDEEVSLFPRLRKKLNEADLARITTLESEHRKMDHGHAYIEKIASKWLAEGFISTGEVNDLTATLKELQQIYKQHIAIEDNEILPLAGSVLDPWELDAVGREMMSRRGIKSVPLILATESRK